MIEGGSASFLRFWFLKPFKMAEDSDGMLAVIATGSTQFIEDNRFLFEQSFLIT